MIKYDLVENGYVVLEKVRRNVLVRLDGVRVKYKDVHKISELERHQGGIYTRIDPAPIYNGYYEEIGEKSNGVINKADFTVTYDTAILPLDIETCRANLLRCVDNCYISADETEGYDIEAINADHINAVNLLDNRSDIVAYDHHANWPPCNHRFK